MISFFLNFVFSAFGCYHFLFLFVIIAPSTVKAIILTRRIYNDFPKLTSLRVPKLTILTHSQRSIGQYMFSHVYV